MITLIMSSWTEYPESIFIDVCNVIHCDRMTVDTYVVFGTHVVLFLGLRMLPYESTYEYSHVVTCADYKNTGKLSNIQHCTSLNNVIHNSIVVPYTGTILHYPNETKMSHLFLRKDDNLRVHTDTVDDEQTLDMDPQATMGMAQM